MSIRSIAQNISSLLCFRSSVRVPGRWKSGYSNDSYQAGLLARTFSFAKLARVLKEDDKPSQGSTVLDLGCGQGYFLLSLLDRFDCVIGADRNPIIQRRENQLALAAPERWAEKYHGLSLFDVTMDLLQAERCDLGRLKLLSMSPETIPVGDQSVDVVFALDMLEHVTDRDRMLAEVHRVLKPGGLFIYTVPNSRRVAGRLRSLLGRIAGVAEDPDTRDHANYDWKSELKRVESHFEIDRVSGFPFGIKTFDLSILVRARRSLPVQQK